MIHPLRSLATNEKTLDLPSLLRLPLRAGHGDVLHRTLGRRLGLTRGPVDVRTDDLLAGEGGWEGVTLW